MKLKIIDENNFILFIIDKNIIPKLEEKELSDYLKEIFLRIKNKYNIEIYGYYDVTIYVDKIYGLIIKLVKEELEYLSYYGKQIEMKIIISNNQVFYKVSDIYDIPKKILAKCNIYLYNGEIYLELKEELDFITLGILVENSIVVFENTENIKKKGKILEIR